MPSERAYVPNMTAALVTADKLLHMNTPDKRIELVRGVLVVREPPGYRHGRVAMQLYDLLAAHVKRTGTGMAFASEIGFTLASGPDTVRAPDVGFISRERLPDPDTQGFPLQTPDLVVEVLSPNDRPGETLAKVGDWLEAGTRLVWVIDPERRLARVYRHDGSETSIPEENQLDGEEVLPGFSCRLASIL